MGEKGSCCTGRVLGRRVFDPGRVYWLFQEPVTALLPPQKKKKKLFAVYQAEKKRNSCLSRVGTNTRTVEGVFENRFQNFGGGGGKALDFIYFDTMICSE